MHINPGNNLAYLDDVDIRGAKRTQDMRNPYAMGYGKRIPTCWKILLPDMRWRRVYVACCSNAGTSWVSVKGQMSIIGPEAEYLIRAIIKTQS